MVEVAGLIGLRPSPKHVSQVTSPPYDVIKPGTPLEKTLRARPRSVFHVILGDKPEAALAELRTGGAFIEDEHPAYYVYEQRFGTETRTGIFVAAKVTPYEDRQVIRHEKTFDAKVRGRIALREATGFTFGPVFVLTKAPINAVLEAAKTAKPIYEFESDFGGQTDLHGVRSRVWRIDEASELGGRIAATLAPHPLYIADGHHRYHAALRFGQTHFLSYVTDDARILAYDRVLKGRRSWSEVRERFEAEPVERFETPPKHHFTIYTREGCFRVPFARIPDDVVGRLDCAILERELYEPLGLTHDDIADPARFDYYPESAVDEMKAVVDRGDYDAAVALHPVSLEELIAVADAGLSHPDVVMPEKSTFFSPKILTGLFIYRHRR